MPYKYPEYRQIYNGASGAHTNESIKNAAMQGSTASPQAKVGNDGYSRLSETMSKWQNQWNQYQNAPKPGSGVDWSNLMERVGTRGAQRVGNPPMSTNPQPTVNTMSEGNQPTYSADWGGGVRTNGYTGTATGANRIHLMANTNGDIPAGTPDPRNGGGGNGGGGGAVPPPSNPRVIRDTPTDGGRRRGVDGPTPDKTDWRQNFLNPDGSTNYDKVADWYSTHSPTLQWTKGRGDLAKMYHAWVYDPQANDSARRSQISFEDFLRSRGMTNFNRGNTNAASSSRDLQDRLTSIANREAGAGGGAGDGAGGGGQQGGGGSNPQNDHLTYIEKLIRDAYSRKLDDNMRQMRASAAMTGMQDSGAYLSAMGDVTGRNAAEEQGALSQILFTADQNERDRLLKKLLGEMGLEGTKYSADAQSNAAMAAAQLGLEGVLAGVAQRDRGDLLDYNLGLEGISRDIYGIDQRSMLEWARLLQDLGPEGFLASILGREPGGYVRVR